MKNEKSRTFIFPPQNFAGLSSPYADLETARVAILPVPYDSTTEWHSGAREGPQAIINASQYLEVSSIQPSLLQIRAELGVYKWLTSPAHLFYH